MKLKCILILFFYAGVGFAATLPQGILGGTDNGASWAAFFDDIGNIYPIDATLLPSTGNIYSVSINSLGKAVIGGDHSYLAFVSSPSVVTPITISTGRILSVSINDSGSAAVAATNAPGIYGALVSPSGVVTEIINTNLNGGTANGAAINDNGYAIIGGETFVHNAYGVLIQPSGTQIVYQNAYVGFENSVSINASNISLVGGGDGSSTPDFAFFVSPNGVVTPLSLPTGTQSQIMSVDINNLSNGLIGGHISGAPYAAIVSSGGVVTPLSGIPVTINTVALNDSNEGVIGGDGFAALVSPSGTVTNLAIPPTTNITSVAIDAQGEGVIVGSLGSAPYAAYVSPSGALTNFSNLPLLGAINSVSLGPFSIIPPSPPPPSQIPITGLSGNNKRFAEYINSNASQDVSYFLPSLSNGTLEQALESAAPTRNAIALFSADNNLFSFNQGLSVHLQNHRHFKENTLTPSLISTVCIDEARVTAQNEAIDSSENFSQFLCSRPSQDNDNQENLSLMEESRQFSFWFEGIGFLASQKSQQQTVGFTPYTGGFILALDHYVGQKWQVGGGIAYAYTHAHENRDAGYSNINQELLFTYAAFNAAHWYLNTALWAGMFQIHNVREIHLTGSHFRSSSQPNGWQLLPHLELGYEYNIPSHKIPQSAAYSGWILSPFAMIDWANNWEGSYREKGNSPFNAGQKSHFSSFLRSEAGLHLSELFAFSSWRFKCKEGISYVNKTPFKVGTMSSFLVGSPGFFIVETLTSSKNLVAAQGALVFEPKNQRYPYGSLTYYGEFGNDYRSHQLILEINFDFRGTTKTRF